MAMTNLKEVEFLVVVHVVIHVMHEKVVESEVLDHQQHKQSHSREPRLVPDH